MVTAWNVCVAFFATSLDALSAAGGSSRANMPRARSKKVLAMTFPCSVDATLATTATAPE
jgi:hypothetical protein